MAAHDLGVLEAVGAGLLQGVAVVFPISGLGHGVLAGSLGDDAGANIAPANAPYLYAYLHLGIGLALLGYFWRDWLRVLRGLLGTVIRPVSTPGERRWAQHVLVGVVPSCVALAILAPHARPLLRHPLSAALVLAGNGLFLLVVWAWWRRSPRAGGLSGTHRAPLSRHEDAETFTGEMAAQRLPRILLLGLLLLGALIPGVSGVGLALVGALAFGLTQEQAVRVALLLLTPFMITWGLRDLPDLGRSEFDGVRTEVIISGACALVAAYLATAVIVRYFRRASLRLFGCYCLVLGAVSAYALSR